MSTNQPMPTVVSFGEELLDRMVRAVEKVRERLARSTQALDAAGVPYAVIGGNAVAAWVSRLDPGAARNTVDVDLMVNRADFDRVREAMERVGFVSYELLGVNMFLDGPEGRPSDAVHLLFGGEKVRAEYALPAPEITTADRREPFQLLDLEPLVTMKLTSFRRKDQVHIQDMIRVGLIDSSWLSRFPPQLAGRLQELLDDPDG
jgi:hypothetical protein